LHADEWEEEGEGVEDDVGFAVCEGGRGVLAQLSLVSLDVPRLGDLDDLRGDEGGGTKDEP